jgi:hypothetical protein
LIRPALLATLRPWREAIAAAAAGVFGLWVAGFGGLLFLPAGLAILAFATAWAVSAIRRARFTQAVAAPGIVEVDEGQIGYLGPAFGAYVALPDIVELRLLTMGGRRLWRLKQADGQALLIPVDAAGADRLFDAFASLPGLDSAALLAALDAPAAGGATGNLRLVWSRPSATRLRARP